MTPFVERQTLPQGPRRWLLVVVGALLVMPVGTLLPTSDAEPWARAVAILAILILAPLLGLALAQPRRTITVQAAADGGTIAIRTSGQLPDPRARTQTWPLSAARTVELEDRGTPVRPAWGVRIDLAGDDPIHLNAYADRDLAQDTVDHLVLLGLPGRSRGAEREASLTAGPPETWL